MNPILRSLDLSSAPAAPQAPPQSSAAAAGPRTASDRRRAGNDITVQGAVGLAHGLEQAQGIAELNLGRNNLGDEGAAVLAGALGSCRTLKSLSLWGACGRASNPPPRRADVDHEPTRGC